MPMPDAPERLSARLTRVPRQAPPAAAPARAVGHGHETAGPGNRDGCRGPPETKREDQPLARAGIFFST